MADRLMSERKTIDIFAIFHLNLAYSSVEEEQRPTVLKKCYWPLLHLIRTHRVPIGIEASGFTLETAAAIDPDWIAELRSLIAEGLAECVGAGYVQLAGPLVPAEVNDANLRIGNEVYERLLGVKPSLALVNEQAYSSGLVGRYLNAGYSALFMEWDNPASAHPEWDSEWRYLPQKARGTGDDEIDLLWNHSTSFQKFQRYAHGEMDLNDYLHYLRGHQSASARVLALYGNDAEVFDFRPGRFTTEAVVEHSEWDRIGELVSQLSMDGGFEWVSPSTALEKRPDGTSGNLLRLESAEAPVPVKKQSKYNILRWAVTGRDDIGVNTRCYRIAAALQGRADATEEQLRELCYLWSCDFRTHITTARWQAFLDRLARFEELLGVEWRVGTPQLTTALGSAKGCRVSQDARFIDVETPTLRVRLNAKRGLAVDSVRFGDAAEPVAMTLPHGYFDDIAMTADYYTGHLVFERPGEHKVTDLSAVEARVLETPGGVIVEALVPTPLGPVHKRVIAHSDEARLTTEYECDWENAPSGSLRLGHLTLNPRAFDREALWFASHNGGSDPEVFNIERREIDHGRPVSLLVTATTGLGMTGGYVDLGDDVNRVRVEVDRCSAAPVGMVSYREAGSSYLCRLALSVMEVDDTRKPTGTSEVLRGPIRVSIVG